MIERCSVQMRIEREVLWVTHIFMRRLWNVCYGFDFDFDFRSRERMAKERPIKGLQKGLRTNMDGIARLVFGNGWR